MKPIFFKRERGDALRNCNDGRARLPGKLPARDPIAFAAVLEILG